MRFVPDGPDIPNSLILKWKEGKVLFLAGAGVSVPSKLPLFDGLALDVYILDCSSVSKAQHMKPRWRSDIDRETRDKLIYRWLLDLPYDARLKFCLRPEECEESVLLADIWSDVNRHLGTAVNSISQLVEQLGVARFGHHPKVADTFCGSGSIPFEAARIGCEVYASDLNPIASMLSWGAFNIIGASAERRAEMERAQQVVSAAVDDQISFSTNFPVIYRWHRVSQSEIQRLAI